MKPVRLDFIPDRRWVWVWGATLAVCLGLTSAMVWHWLPLSPTSKSLQAQAEHIEALQQQLARLHALAASASAVKPDPRQASLVQAVQLLQLDHNPAFASAENMQVPGTHLRSFTLEATTNRLRLTYEMDTALHASAITQALNAGYEQRPWQLESVSAVSRNSGNSSSSASNPSAVNPGTVPPPSMGGMTLNLNPGQPEKTAFRGVWFATLSKL